MNQGFNEVKASSIAGVALDCDLSTGLKIGGGTATDNTAALNAFLATASATNPIKLIMDGPSLITGLMLTAAGYTTIEGLGRGTGFYMKSGSNSTAIQNPLPGTMPGTNGANVILRDFMVNGNRGNGTNGNSTNGDPRGGSPLLLFNLHLCNLNGVVLDSLYLYDAPSFGVLFDNCHDVVIEGCTVINPNLTPTFNNDGIHFNGPASDIRMSNIEIANNNSDDAIALNAPEGYSGVIDRVTIVGCTFNGVYNALRAYGNADNQIGSVVFSDNIGVAAHAVLAVGFNGGTGDASGRSLVFSGNTFQLTGSGQGAMFLLLASNAGDITMTDCTWLNPIAGSFISGSSNISSITLNNCRIYRTTSGNNTSTPVLSAGSATTIGRFTVNGFSVVNQAGQSYAAIAEFLAMTNVTITKLFIASLDYTNIALLADSYTNIGSISGAWQPESNIQSKTAAYTLLPTDRTVLASTTAASFAVALPANAYAGQKHTIKNTGTANTLTVTGTVDGAANPTLATLAKMTVEYDGTHWWTV